MSTCNFPQPQLSKIYAIAMGGCDELQYNDEIENIRYALAKIKGFQDRYNDTKWLGSDRQILGEYDLEVYNHDWKQWEPATIYITIQSGYYEGAIIDAELGEVRGYKLSKENERKIASFIGKVEKILSEMTTKLIRVAVFSNGEGVYKQI